jgi:hypothetical protein
MINKTTVWFLSLLSLNAAPILYAGENAPGYQVKIPFSQEAVLQKLQLVNMLLAKSPSLERASRSDDPAVRQMTEAARTLYTNAKNDLNNGNAARAEVSLDEALQLIENASRLAPDPSQTEAKQRARYTELKDGLQGLQSTYRDLRLHLFPKGVASPPVESNLEDIQSQLDHAETLAHDGRYRDAVELLSNAHASAISALNKLLGSTSLTYDFKFQSPAKEFDVEMALYLSYEELVPIAYSELKPSADSIKLSERYVQKSHEMRDTAQQQAAHGDHQSALNTLLEAIKLLQTALRSVGLTLQD